MKRFMLGFALLLLAVVPVVQAQGLAGALPDAIFYQSADSGAFTDNGDGTYTLVLNNVGDEIRGIAKSPLVVIGRGSTLTYANDWTLAHQSSEQGLYADSALLIEEGIVRMTLTMPSYDVSADSITYIAEIYADNTTGKDILEGFGAADLVIDGGEGFEAQLMTAHLQIMMGTRAAGGDASGACQALYNQRRFLEVSLEQGTIDQAAYDAALAELLANMQEVGCETD